MSEEFSRTELLLGQDAIKCLNKSRVAVFGLGGVGSYTVEALVRSGIGALDLIDNDNICPSNLNRQLLATRSSLGRPKVDVAAERIADINPGCLVRTYKTFYLPETAGSFDFSKYDYVVDAIDTVTGKIQLVLQADACGIPIISSMGTGNKLDPTAFRVADLSETSVCPLARILRKELKKRGLTHLKVVYSTEAPMPVEMQVPSVSLQNKYSGSASRPVPGSVAFVPSVAGLILAGEVIKDLIAAGVKNDKS